MSYYPNFPQWIDHLFLQFSIAYENAWTYAIRTEEELLAKKLMWFSQLAGFKDIAIDSAIKLAIKTFKMPPSVAEMIELCQSETRRLKPEGLQLEDKRRAPPSPLLAEYMARNPPQRDEEFETLRRNYQGTELGTEVIKLIKKRLGGKK